MRLISHVVERYHKERNKISVVVVVGAGPKSCPAQTVQREARNFNVEALNKAMQKGRQASMSILQYVFVHIFIC